MTNILLFLAFTFLAILQVQAEVSLGIAADFVVLASSAITNTGLSVLDGEIGIYPGTAVTGFLPGIFSGTGHFTDVVAQNAQIASVAAYDAAVVLKFTSDLTGMDLGGMTLLPGTYHFDISASISGVLTLDGQGSSGAQWIFQIGSTLITAASASVIVVNGGQACNVFWQVGSSATLGAGTEFVGNVLAHDSIVLLISAVVDGGLYALNGAVTMIENKILPKGLCILGTPLPTTTSSSSASTSTSSTSSAGGDPGTIPTTTSSSLPTAINPSTTSTSSAPTTSSSGTTIPNNPSALSTSSIPTSSKSTLQPTKFSNSTISSSSSTSRTASNSITTRAHGNYPSGISYGGGSNGTRSRSFHQITNTATALVHTSHPSQAHFYSKSTSTTSSAYITTAVNIIHVTITCSAAPTTITTYGQTFLITETGVTTITCPSLNPRPSYIGHPHAVVVSTVLITPVPVTATKMFPSGVSRAWFPPVDVTGTKVGTGHSAKCSDCAEATGSEYGPIASASPTMKVYTGSGSRAELSGILTILGSLFFIPLLL